MIKDEASYRKKIIVWNMTYGCNFNCSECFQPFNKRKHPPKQVILKIIDVFSEKFKEGYLLKLTGGEIFSIADFQSEIIPCLLKKTNFRLTVTSNFAYPLKIYKKFLKMAKKRLSRMSFSWHHEYFSPEDFCDKVKKLRKFMDRLEMNEALLKINLVLIPQNFSSLKYIKKSLGGMKNIKLHFQVFRIGEYGRKFYRYTKTEKGIIKELVEDYSPLGYNRKRHFQGRLCSAGINYLVVNPSGDVFTCHEAYELGSNNGKYSLGNLVDETFEPLKREIFCPFDYCTVPVVAIRNIVKKRRSNL